MLLFSQSEPKQNKKQVKNNVNIVNFIFCRLYMNIHLDLSLLALLHTVY